MFNTRVDPDHTECQFSMDGLRLEVPYTEEPSTICRRRNVITPYTPWGTLIPWVKYDKGVRDLQQC